MPSRVALLVLLLDIATAVRVSPELDPKSHDTFFGKDYPDDHRVQTPHHFEHPFPVVQKSDDFDKDYVKDENADGGEWAAQMQYDQLRHDIDNKKRAVEKAKKQAEGHDADLEAAKKAEEDAAAAAEAAKEKAAEAKAFEEMAKKLEDEAGQNVSDANATDVSANMTLEECKKQLGIAKEKVKKLREEAERAARMRGEAAKNRSEAEHAADAHTIEALEKAHADAAAAAEKAEAEAAALQKQLDTLREKAEKEEKEHKEVEKSHHELKEEIEQTEEDMKKATEKLRTVRHGQVTPGGGISREEKAHKSLATTCSVGVLAVASVVALI